MINVDIAREEWATHRHNYGLYGGRSEWRDNKFIESSSYIGDDSKEIIPVFAANRMTPWRPSNSWHTHYRGLEDRIDILGDKNFVVRRYRPIEGEVDVSTVPDEDLGMLVINAIEDVKKEFKDSIESSMDYGLPESHLTNGYGWPQYWRYKELVGHFIGGSGWALHHTRTWINGNVIKYLVGSYFLADVSYTPSGNADINPLICLVTKPKYMEYIRWAIALGKEIDRRVVQIWIHPEFDIPRSRWRGLRPYMRKQFLIPMYDAGVPVIEKESFKELFKNYTPPKLNNIRDYRKWLMDCSIESINNIKSNLK